MSRQINSPDDVATPYNTDPFSHKHNGTGVADGHQPHRHSEGERKRYDTHFPRSPSPSSPRTSPRADQDAYAHNAPSAVVQSPVSQYGDGVYDDFDEERFDMTEDQRQALLELRNERLDLGYTETDPPEYDVTERIRQLNEELALDPTPGLDEDDDRRHSIKFKDDPVTLVVPPPEFDESEDELGFSRKSDDADNAQPDSEKEDGDILTEEIISRTPAPDDSKRSNSPTAEEISDIDEETDQNEEPKSVESKDLPSSLKSPAQQQTDANHSDEGSAEEVHSGDEESSNKGETPDNKDSNSNSNKKKAERVLVERNGKFELVDMNELTPEERELYVIKSDRKTTDSVSSQSSKNSSSSGKKSRTPFPPKTPKPNTTGTQENTNRRSKSAQSNRSAVLDGFEYNSPYALTPQQKKTLEQQKRARERKQREDEQRKKQEEEDNKQKSEAYFKSWLNIKKEKLDEENKKKRDQERMKREEEQEQKAKDDSYRDAMLRDWLERKYLEKERERRLTQAHKREHMQSTPTAAERQKAFKRWLRSKEQAKKEEKEAVKNSAKLSRLKSRQAHKSQQLAKAMSFAQGYSFTDYYGYRF